jgi:hypothetical protein
VVAREKALWIGPGIIHDKCHPACLQDKISHFELDRDRYDRIDVGGSNEENDLLEFTKGGTSDEDI